MKPRLIQVVVQPVVVGDDGDNLVPLQVEQIVVPGADWASFSAERWPQIMQEIAAQLAPTETP